MTDEIKATICRILREADETKHCVGEYFSRYGNKCCALGLIAKETGALEDRINAHLFSILSSYEYGRIFDWNDQDLLSFAEIANRIEREL